MRLLVCFLLMTIMFMTGCHHNYRSEPLPPPVHKIEQIPKKEKRLRHIHPVLPPREYYGGPACRRGGW